MANSRLGLRTRLGLVRSYTEGSPGGDADAILFLTAAGITDLTITVAIQQLVIDLKSYGLWSKMKAIYPFVGGLADTHKWNLKDARDLDAAFRLSFVGGWTHSSTGALPNGTNAYADTFLNPSVVINNVNDGHLSYYSRSNTSSINAVDIGCGDTITSFNMFIKFGLNFAGACINMSDTNAFTNSNDTTGLYHANQNNTANIRKMFRNAVSIATQNVSQNTTPSLNIWIGARNNINAQFYTNRECAFASVGNGLTDTEAANLYTAVQAFQTTLGRQV